MLVSLKAVGALRLYVLWGGRTKMTTELNYATYYSCNKTQWKVISSLTSWYRMPAWCASLLFLYCYLLVTSLSFWLIHVMNFSTLSKVARLHHRHWGYCSGTSNMNFRKMGNRTIPQWNKTVSLPSIRFPSRISNKGWSYLFAAVETRGRISNFNPSLLWIWLFIHVGIMITHASERGPRTEWCVHLLVCTVTVAPGIIHSLQIYPIGNLTFSCLM